MSTYTVSNCVGSIRRPDESTLELLSPSTPVTLQLDSGKTEAPLRITLNPWLCRELTVYWAFPNPYGAAMAGLAVVIAVAVNVPRTATATISVFVMYEISDDGYSRRPPRAPLRWRRGIPRLRRTPARCHLRRPTRGRPHRRATRLFGLLSIRSLRRDERRRAAGPDRLLGDAGRHRA